MEKRLALQIDLWTASLHVIVMPNHVISDTMLLILTCNIESWE
jgi:hypothetical protein